MKLEIITPERIVFSGEVELVSLPGINGLFAILDDHAPIVAALRKGKLRYKTADSEETEFSIGGGFVEAKNNTVTVCVE
ncbi:MAG: ATP synthase F1 subunit epsilon [Prevotellaceae bacterium]|jgi:F-type H+-transporting ATPase subunit epsilon|nr:ATP synthase F1 subunit epsilon [Prevotellaceae bacterium]